MNETTTVTVKGWAEAVLQSTGLPQTQVGVDVLVAVTVGEGCDAAWNPAATELKLSGSTNFNDVGVQNYISPAQGVAAVAATLHDGRYPAVLNELGQGTDGPASITAWALGPWGTFHDADGIPDVDEALAVFHRVQNDRQTYYSRVISGPMPDSGPLPAPPPVPVELPPTNGPAEPVEEVCVVDLPVLVEGSSGGAVKAAQSLLNTKFNARPALAVDGDFGPATAAMVAAFQAGHMLVEDRTIGENTWGVLLNG